jgi:alkylated DNA nucleotide flippase Atl1
MDSTLNVPSAPSSARMSGSDIHSLPLGKTSPAFRLIGITGTALWARQEAATKIDKAQKSGIFRKRTTPSQQKQDGRLATRSILHPECARHNLT